LVQMTQISRIVDFDMHIWNVVETVEDICHNRLFVEKPSLVIAFEVDVPILWRRRYVNKVIRTVIFDITWISMTVLPI
jgi:hypothetical protein